LALGRGSIQRSDGALNGLLRHEPAESAPEQQDQDDYQQDQAEAPAVIMIWRAEIKAAPTENENQNNQEYDQAHRSAPMEVLRAINKPRGWVPQQRSSLVLRIKGDRAMRAYTDLL
jgi:hypothetical protein